MHARNHFFQSVEDGFETQRKVAARVRPDAAAGDIGEPGAGFVEHAEARDPESRIDTEDPHSQIHAVSSTAVV